MRFSTEDTIVAIATPPGRGGIGVVRLSGPDAHPLACALIGRERPLAPRHATFATIRLKDGDPTGPADAIDHAVVTLFPAPHSYTGDDVVEISAHGSPVVLHAIVAAAMAAGARHAEPGEFTLRAFLNGRIDLMQAEAVADLIDAVTPLQARAAFDQLDGTLTRAIAEIDASLFDVVARLEASVDFPEEGYHFVDPGAVSGELDGVLEKTEALLRDARRGRMVRDGLLVVIVGEPNVGKSSLFNALVGSARAIVTDVPGTTRDLVSELVDLQGLRVTLVDTAGLRAVRDVVEAEGVARARQSAGVADLVLRVEDLSQPRADSMDLPSSSVGKVLCVANKADLPAAWRAPGVVEVSAATGAGLDALRNGIAAALDADLQRDRPSITNVRHVALVERAHAALLRARTAVSANASLSEEFVLADLADARAALEEISGRRTSDDLLTHIFARFCVGK
ncbi:MAG TPA: tRNA uridine-5-carboxymethylaminomethyl(34) synthesis GTPase MnmE [Vicinamibacterales bacterium]|nr:tRNA uridine-5-carboxymethylaminomethyl(34) synthesis GTPase MnmE [Vicinamibacterales bacterium]